MNLKNSMQLILLFSNSIHQNIKGAATQLLPAKSPAPPTYLVESSTPWRASEPHEDKTCFHWLFCCGQNSTDFQKMARLLGFSETSFPYLKLFGSNISQITCLPWTSCTCVPLKFWTPPKMGTAPILRQLTTFNWTKPGFPRHGTQLLAAVVTSLP